MQGNREKGGEFAELRGYLLSKLLWNPDCDVEKVMDDFIQGYYGISGKYIKQYISLMESELKKSKLRLSMDGEPEAIGMVIFQKFVSINIINCSIWLNRV